MNKNVKNALQLAVLAGFVAGTASNATATEKAKTDATGDKAKSEKSGCHGKNGCSGSCSTPTDKAAKEPKKAEHLQGKMKKGKMAAESETPAPTEPAKE